MHALLRPIRLRTLEPERERRATWLELFFDLIFVAAVAQVAGPLGHDASPAGVLRFAFFFSVIFWAWLGHTTFSTRFDTDDLTQRVCTVAQMFFAAVMAVNAAGAIESRDSAGFAASYGALRLVQVLQYARAHRQASARPLTGVYLGGFAIAAALWLASALAPLPARLVLWAAAFAVDLVTPLLAERHAARFPPDPAHLPERYGLFAIILLGESVVRVMHGMESHAGWSAPAAICAAGGLGISFIVWWWYFDGVRAAAERRVRSRRDAARLRVWSFAHLAFFLSLAIGAIGVEHAIAVANRPHLGAGDAALLAAAFAAMMVAIAALFASADESRPASSVRRTLLGHTLLALVTVALGGLGERLAPPAFVLLLAALCAAQVAVTVRGRTTRGERDGLLAAA